MDFLYNTLKNNFFVISGPNVIESKRSCILNVL